MSPSGTEHSPDGWDAFADRPGSTGTVMIVEDDPMVSELLRMSLEADGLLVRSAADGAEALHQLTDGSALPDVVVSDIEMPDVDGFDLLRTVRQDSALRGLPLIFLTARGDTADAVAGINLGADDYIRKPVAMPELVARVRGRIQRHPGRLDADEHDPRTGLLRHERFVEELAREAGRARIGGERGSVAVLELHERRRVVERFGEQSDRELALQVVPMLSAGTGPLELIGRDADGRFLVLLPETSGASARAGLGLMAQRVVREAYAVSGERISVTPVVGFAEYGEGDGNLAADRLLERASVAAEAAAMHLDLQPVAWSSDLEAQVERGRLRAEGSWRSRLTTPLQVAATLGLGVLTPFLVYLWLYQLGIDVSAEVYTVVVVAILLTATSIWAEGFLALQPTRPPDEPGAPPPPASAVIAAYLPNEAATIIDTVEAFLEVEYPYLQVVLAYNTPRPLPVEDALRDIAVRDARFLLLEVPGSTSKAQNVNAALAQVTGEFVGIFDADHQPTPDAFHRAWRWLSNGYDVVQGHCVIRNGAVSAVARTVAVEFETIYAVSHPGRARLHGFGVFGGSNGYWLTSRLRATRMHGSMLTEDIDSSLRVLEDGGRIASDPALLSRELAPTTVGQLWNQRMRWAQGWFQVSLGHLLRGWRSPHMSLRQKLGLTFLLGWREIYPWVSLQVLPLLGFIAWREGGIVNAYWLVPLFVLTTLFTLSTGPGQVLFAYRLAAPEVRRHRRWFWLHLAVSSLVYTELKNTIARVAQLKELNGETTWRVTPRRTSGAAPGA